MAICFRELNHSYESLVPDDINWLSATTLIAQFKAPFEKDTIAASCSRKKNSKWYGLSPAEIKQIWASEANRSTELGNWYHAQREQDLISHSTLHRYGKELPIIKPIIKGGVKIAPDQKLTDGIYPEHLMYLKSAGVCGQSDLVEVADGFVHIGDYKTNKEIKQQGYLSWDGIAKKLSSPLTHLDDCNYVHYNLQLSLYMYMVLKHNPRLKPGSITVYHILFEEESRDKYDNPIYKVDAQGNFIVKEIVEYKMPYLKNEVIAMINWVQGNRTTIKNKAA